MNAVRLKPWGIILLIVVAALWTGHSIAVAQPEETVSPAQQESEGDKPTVPQGAKKQSDDWYDKGILLTVYGNDKAAIAHFKKAIQLDPQHHDAYFQMGVSYGELGQYDIALRQIEKAIELNPEKAVFYYGRARVRLLSGDKEKAMSDFEKAADMGSRDAVSYLKRVSEQ